MPGKTMGWTIATLLALCALWFAGRGAAREHRFLRRAYLVPGQVLELIEHRGSKGSRTYRPRVHFIDRRGTAHQFEGSQGSNPPEFQPHDTVTVAYDDTPDSARIVTFGQRYGGWVILGTFGVTVLLLRLVFLVGNHLVPRIYLPGGGGW